ncbi:U1 small nuclear ribonucleoprotein 70 kDa [Rhynchospora pubera]|uniref:U1 small nuclear ribonucleoprotein 70 kDa n=1 Tax=Rhynchospora pubera TaxID=906938 RepID=A0AAV8E064_9POAL|nr:U1 small nuclear ribonucleoprotein 70 kDa [Rhynchospora pubera]
MGDFNQAMMRTNDAAVQARTKAQNRANVLQLKLIGQSHPTGLTPNLLKLFEPRPPLEYKPPVEKRKLPVYSGIASFVSQFADPGDPEYAPPVEKVETKAEKKARIRQDKLEKGAAKAVEELEKYDPVSDPNMTGDPYKTLFVARLNYETSEHRIKREFEAYGPIKRVRTITDKKTNKPRGYAFIEYMHTRDMKNAYKQADGRKIDNRRVLVDVERGRTVPNWRPRRLGGGLGSSRIAGEEAAREPQVTASTHTRSEEPKARDDKDRDREKSRERDRERDRDRGREREKSRERSHDRTRDREDRHNRDYDRERDRDRARDRDREKDRDRERDRERDKERDRGRDRDRDRERDRDRGREKDRECDRERGRESRDRERDRDRDHDHHRDSRSHDRERDRHGADHDDVEHNYNRDVMMPDQDHGEHGYDRYDQQGDDTKYSFGQGQEYYDQHYGGKETAGYNGQMNHGGREAPEEGEAYDERDYGYYRQD